MIWYGYPYSYIYILIRLYFEIIYKKCKNLIFLPIDFKKLLNEA